MKAFFAVVAITFLAGCVTPTEFRGTVSSKAHSEISPPRSFAIVGSNSGSIAEAEIERFMSEAMIAQGFQPAAKTKPAQLAITYAMSIGDPRSQVSSSPDFVWGGQQVSSYTTYSRFMQIKLYDIEGAQVADDATLIWQAEVSSEGSSSN
jgi:hypothetical protein